MPFSAKQSNRPSRFSRQSSVQKIISLPRNAAKINNIIPAPGARIRALNCAAIVIRHSYCGNKKALLFEARPKYEEYLS